MPRQTQFQVGEVVEWMGSRVECSSCYFIGTAAIIEVDDVGVRIQLAAGSPQTVLSSCLQYLGIVGPVPVPEPTVPVVGDLVRWAGPYDNGISFDGTATVVPSDPRTGAVLQLRLEGGLDWGMGERDIQWLVVVGHTQAPFMQPLTVSPLITETERWREALETTGLLLEATAWQQPRLRLLEEEAAPVRDEWALATAELPAVGSRVQTTSRMEEWPGPDQEGEIIALDSDMYVAVAFPDSDNGPGVYLADRTIRNADWYNWEQSYRLFRVVLAPLRSRRQRQEAVAVGDQVLPALFTFTELPMKFGVEIEAYHSSCQWGEFGDIAAMMDDIGIECYDEEYNHQRRPHWKVVSDASLNKNGFELVSPILTGADGLETVRAVMQQLRNNGANVDRSCGLHVHWDAGKQSQDDRMKIAHSYYSTYNQFERLFPVSRKHNDMCKVIQPQHVDRSYYDRYQAVNWSQAFERHGTVEFRQHQGTLMGDKAVAWIMFTHQFMSRSRTDNRSVEKMLKPGPFKGAVTKYEYTAVDYLRQRLQLDPVEHLRI